ncbi:MAG: bifunctional 2-polyprenyl-6-hydroxyphenol methylase/3-demethylubiquinol 3-O-methyltransferase UbiG [Chlamydiales bacterium]
METKVVNNDFYDDLHDEWYSTSSHPIALLRSENATRNPWILEQIEHHMGKHSAVLDIGCGAGFLTNTLAQSGHSVTGIDLSVESLEVAKKRDTTKNVKYIVADAFNLPFAPHSFDAVCAMDLLEHISDPQLVVQQAARVLKPGGLFFFHTFNRNWFSWLVVIKGVEVFVKNTPKNMHILKWFIKPEELKRYMEKEGMEVLHCQGLSPNVWSRAFWKMIFTRKVPHDFQFVMHPKTTCGYVGVARKSQR